MIAGEAQGRRAAEVPALLAAAVALCGGLMPVKVVMVGELFAGEVLMIAVAAVTFLLRGTGPRLAPWFLWTFAGAGMLMLIGYVVSDLAAVTAPAQYLRGWARTALFGLDFLALIIIVSHGERLLWWLGLGLAVGMLGDVLFAETVEFTVTSWKKSWGYPVGLSLALFSGYLPSMAAAVVLGGIGAMALALDFRSLGGVYLLAAGVMATRIKSAWHRLTPLMRWVLAVLAALMATGLVAAVLTQSDGDYHRRRQESNIGRYAGIVVAARAIADSPVIGYGSWAGDKDYLRMLRSEVAKASAGKDVRTGRMGDSILPHSQLLQVWVEGGLLAAILFLLFGLNLLRGLRWLVLYHQSGPLTPLYAVLIINGLWNLLFSPFLGMHRINVALALAALSLLAWERSVAGRRRPAGRPLPQGAKQQQAAEA